jgi:putative membrane protein
MSDDAPAASSPSTSDRLAHERTELAGDRTLMAADRTLMAWIRTALAMISFGFTIYKFLHGFAESGTVHLRRANGPRDLGIFLTALGTGSLVAGLIQHVQMLRQIHISVLRTSVSFYVACAVVILGLLILLGIIANAGPF